MRGMPKIEQADARGCGASAYHRFLKFRRHRLRRQAWRQHGIDMPCNRYRGYET